ncbi:MAG: purine-nucleoside phosphorylase [Candidatus Latescibacterota bacterium]
MSELFEQIGEAAQHILTRTKMRPAFGLVLGTGLGDVAEEIEAEATIPYGEIPHFVESTGIGHEGNLIIGRLGGKKVAVMQGRLHYYEGYSMQQITFPIRVIRALGATDLIVTNAVGGMDPHLDLGDIVVITDHINLMGDNPLIGRNDERLGPRFPDMSDPYHEGRRRLLETIAVENGVTVRRAVLVAVAGPNLETAAEYRFLRRVGADVVGMSMVPENLVAVHGGMKVLGLAIVTDLCRPDALEPADIPKIIATARSSEPTLRKLVIQYLEKA